MKCEFIMDSYVSLCPLVLITAMWCPTIIMAEVSFTAVHGADTAKAVQPTQSYLLSVL